MSKGKKEQTLSELQAELQSTAKSNMSTRGGGYQNIPILTDHGLRLSALNPKYLHTNSTSHTWPFSAIAELVDNAYDPDVDASQLWIDLKTFQGSLALTFTDNGHGMLPEKLYKMLSFGFCEKVAVNDHLPVGHYGNGFKSGSMRLGKDALVFSKKPSVWSLGLLSQTYLNGISADTIIVPMVTWDPKKFILKNANDGGKIALQAILEYSCVKTVTQIREEFRCIAGATGTRIIVFNLRKTSDKKSEFDFTSDINDIQIPNDAIDSEELKYRREQRQDHIPACDYSLRAYCAILYLKPKMQIILRGKKVKTVVIAKSLSRTEVDVYRPTSVDNAKPVKLVFGFSQNRNHYGIMMYHRNRLIKPYIRVGHQMKANNLGIGVIGVIECDFLQPTHNKQDFDYTKAYRACMTGLGRKLNEYWQEKKSQKKSSQQQIAEMPEELEKLPDELWVQCDNPKCLKWRRLPDTVNEKDLPDKWFCKDHPLPKMRSCDIPEEPYWEEKKEIVPYKKEVKKQIQEERLQMKETKSNEEKKKLADVKAKYDKELETERKKRLESEQLIKRREEELKNLKQSLKITNSSPTSQPTTPVKSSVNSVLIQSTPKAMVIMPQSTSPYATRRQTSTAITRQPAGTPIARQQTSTPIARQQTATPVQLAANTPLAQTNTPVKIRLPFNSTKPATLMPKQQQTVTTLLVGNQTFSLTTTPSKIGALAPNVSRSAPAIATLLASASRAIKVETPKLVGSNPQVKTVTIPAAAANNPAALSQLLSALTAQAQATNKPIQMRTGLVNNKPMQVPMGLTANRPLVLTTVLPKGQATSSVSTGSPVVTLSLPRLAPAQVPITSNLQNNVNLVTTPQTILLQNKNYIVQSKQQSTPKPSMAQIAILKKQPSTSTIPKSVSIASTTPQKQVTISEESAPHTIQEINHQLALVGIEAITGKSTGNNPPMSIGKAKLSNIKPSIIGKDSSGSLPTMITTMATMKPTPTVSTASSTSPISRLTAQTSQTSSVSLNGTLKRPLEIPDDDDEVTITGSKAPKKSRLHTSTATDGVKPEPSSPPKTNENTATVKSSKEAGKCIVIPPDILKSASQVIIDDIKSRSESSLITAFVHRSEQLIKLRSSVCRLLAVLVPDLSLPDVKNNTLDDDTIDQLLKEVLEANKDGE